MAATIAMVKPLKGKEASRFWAAFKASGVRKEAIEKAKRTTDKSFNSK